MPAKFINVNNSGRANFRNVNNSGRAVFGEISAGTTTTTTTVAQAAINIYARQIAPTALIDFHYSIDGGSTWNFVGTSVSETCTNVATITIPQGTNLVLRAGSNTNINTIYSSNRTNASTTCPTWDAGSDACTWPTLTNVPTRDVAFTINQEQTEAC
jgi:hypothetical protein